MADTTTDPTSAAQATVMRTVRIIQRAVNALDMVNDDALAAAAAQLSPAEFAWTAAQVDGLGRRLGDLFSTLAQAAEQHGAEPENWAEIGQDLSRASDGVYEALGQIDPDVERHNIDGHLGDEEE
jgi:hypothetical protein